MKTLMLFVGSMATWALVTAQTPSDYVPPIATLVGLLALIIKYIRDHSVENDQHEHYETFIRTQREYYESTITDLRLQLAECQKGRNGNE